MRYQLLCCSDTHETVPAIVETPEALCWLHAGDFYLDRCKATADQALIHCADRLGPVQGGAAYRWFKQSAMPILAVRGNHDGFDAWGFFRHAQDISAMAVRVAPGLVVAGIGWHGDYYYELPEERHLEKACRVVEKVLLRIRRREDRLILLTHYPAYAPPPPCDWGQTYAALRELAAPIEPVAVIQGHAHGWFGTCHEVPAEWGRMLVVNPGPHGGMLSLDTASGQASYSS